MLQDLPELNSEPINNSILSPSSDSGEQRADKQCTDPTDISDRFAISGGDIYTVSNQPDSHNFVDRLSQLGCDWEVSNYTFCPMATEMETGAPPPPPPLPGSTGAMMLPHWRDTYQPIREAPPSREVIEKQQYAHLPDKLLNSLNKDKKPFTYTPQGASSEKGVLDLSEIRSPKMKKRLMANLQTGEEETDQLSDERCSPSNMQQTMQYSQQAKQCPNLFQQPFNPMVLPPLTDNNRLQVRSPSPLMGQSRKEVRFAPSPILVSDDEELASVLQKRRQDVESRAKIVTNEPILEQHNQFNGNSIPGDVQQMPFDVDDLVKRSSQTVQTARDLFGGMPTSPPIESNSHNVVNSGSANYPTDTDSWPYKNRSSEVNKTIDQIEQDLNELQLNDSKPMFVNQSSQNEMNCLNSEGRVCDVNTRCPSPTPVPQIFMPSQPTFVAKFDSGEQTGNSSVKFCQQSEQSEILKQMLDGGLQEEIDKFEQISRETAMSPMPDMYLNLNKAPPHPNYSVMNQTQRKVPPPVPPKPKMNRDGRTSCPPYTDYQPQVDNDFVNSFRCISPSFEILKKTQSSGYNYVTKPRPFYRCGDDQSSQNERSAFRPVSQQSFNTFKPIDTPTFSEPHQSERIIPIQRSIPESAPNYGSLPRRIKLNRDLSLPKSYDNSEEGREFLTNNEMYSQLPPKTTNDYNNNNTNQNEPESPKMFYGSQTLPRKINIPGRSHLNQGKTYENPELGREFLSNCGMYSQLPQSDRNGSKNIHQNGNVSSFTSNVGNEPNVIRRQTSLPPSANRLSGTYMQIASSTPPPPVNSQNTVRQASKLNWNQIRKLPPSERPPEPNPSKYTGSHIPSRSFRILQLITGEDIKNHYANDAPTPKSEPKGPVRPTNPPPPPPPRTSMPPSMLADDYGTDF